MNVNIEINYNKLVDEATKIMAEKVVQDYLWANDVDYEFKKVESAKRHKRIIEAIDWTNAPDGISQAAAKSFFEHLMEKLR